VSRFQASGQQRLYWRVLVHTEGAIDGSRSTRPLSWHLVSCADPSSPEAHCVQGQLFLQTNGDPDGHCVTAGTCGHCAWLDARREAADNFEQSVPERASDTGTAAAATIVEAVPSSL
jgi:hypothetical protein